MRRCGLLAAVTTTSCCCYECVTCCDCLSVCLSVCRYARHGHVFGDVASQLVPADGRAARPGGCRHAAPALRHDDGGRRRSRTRTRHADHLPGRRAAASPGHVRTGDGRERDGRRRRRRGRQSAATPRRRGSGRRRYDARRDGRRRRRAHTGHPRRLASTPSPCPSYVPPTTAVLTDHVDAGQCWTFAPTHPTSAPQSTPNPHSP